MSGTVFQGGLAEQLAVGVCTVVLSHSQCEAGQLPRAQLLLHQVSIVGPVKGATPLQLPPPDEGAWVVVVAGSLERNMQLLVILRPAFTYTT